MALSSRRLPSLLRVPASPVPRSRRYYEGATTSRSRNLRSLIVFAPAAHTRPPGSCPPKRSRTRGGRVLAPGLGSPAARLSGLSRVDKSGISQVFRRSVPCLCFAPRPRSNQGGLAIHGRLGAAPATHTAKASATADFGADTQLRHCTVYASRTSSPTPRKTRFRPTGSAFAGRASNPLDRYGRFQFTFAFIPLPCSPDANGFRCRSTHPTRDSPG